MSFFFPWASPSSALVSGLLFKEHLRDGRVSVGNFLIRRGLKIYPAFWVLIGYTIVTQLLNGNTPSKWAIISELSFIQNYHFGLWYHTWSLAVEEHFYLMLAALVWFLACQSKEPFAQLPRIFCFVAVTCLGLRILNLFFHPYYSPASYLYPTHLRIDSLFLGVLLCYLVQYRGLRNHIRHFSPKGCVIIGAILLLLPACLYSREEHRWITVIGYNIFDLGSGLLVLGATDLVFSSSSMLRILGSLGAVSYSVYLWHMPVEFWARRIWPDLLTNQFHYSGYLFTFVFGSILVGSAMARLVEFPVLRLRDRWFPSRQAVRQADSAGAA